MTIRTCCGIMDEGMHGAPATRVVFFPNGTAVDVCASCADDIAEPECIGPLPGDAPAFARPACVVCDAPSAYSDFIGARKVAFCESHNRADVRS